MPGFARPRSTGLLRRPRPRSRTPKQEMPEEIDDSMVITTDPMELLPKRPLADEPRKNDSAFRITWRIRITAPDEARKSETDQRISAPAESENTEQAE